MARHPLCASLRSLPSDLPVDYRWDEVDTQAYFLYADVPELERLKLLTGNANIALAIAVGEWIEHRFRRSGLDPELTYYLDASWAALLDTSYMDWIHLDYPNWKGPIRAPQLLTMGIINEAFYESDDNPEMAWRACYALNLARYVLPDRTAFDAWYETSYSRLEQWHSRQAEGADEEEDIFADAYWQGGPVARELFDPDRPYDGRKAEALLEAYVARLDPDNPFLELEE
jgi:hypothetical protein